MTNEEISKLTGHDIDAMIRRAEDGADWAEIARLESVAMAAKKAQVAPVIKAHCELIAKLAAIKPRAIPVCPEPDDFIERAAHMRDIALAVDAYILALGQDSKENVSGSFDLSLFMAPLTNALDGNAIFELHEVAEELRNETADDDWESRAIDRSSEEAA